jgi:hypothetical protein
MHEWIIRFIGVSIRWQVAIMQYSMRLQWLGAADSVRGTDLTSLHASGGASVLTKKTRETYGWLTGYLLVVWSSRSGGSGVHTCTTGRPGAARGPLGPDRAVPPPCPGRVFGPWHDPWAILSGHGPLGPHYIGPRPSPVPPLKNLKFSQTTISSIQHKYDKWQVGYQNELVVQCCLIKNLSR